MAPRKSTQPKPQLAIGDHVLLGGTVASDPAHWFLGSVLWVGTIDLLIQRSTANGKTWREVVMLSEVRAKGTIEQLVRVQAEARKGVHEFQRAITEAEQALGAARTALWSKLGELADAGLAVIPPDFAQIDADHRDIGEAIETDDAAREAALAERLTQAEPA